MHTSFYLCRCSIEHKHQEDIKIDRQYQDQQNTLRPKEDIKINRGHQDPLRGHKDQQRTLRLR